MSSIFLIKMKKSENIVIYIEIIRILIYNVCGT